jgi:hypothetical protein
MSSNLFVVVTFSLYFLFFCNNVIFLPLFLTNPIDRSSMLEIALPRVQENPIDRSSMLEVS